MNRKHMTLREAAKLVRELEDKLGTECPNCNKGKSLADLQCPTCRPVLSKGQTLGIAAILAAVVIAGLIALFMIGFF